MSVSFKIEVKVETKKFHRSVRVPQFLFAKQPG